MLKLKNLLAASLFLAAIVDCRAQQAAQLAIKVHFPDGSPARGIKVQLVQLERASPRNLLCGVTDETGQLNVGFDAVATLEGKRNGWGLYRFVLMPEDLRWELSDLYYWNQVLEKQTHLQVEEIGPEDWYRKIMRENPKNNWSIGDLIQVQEGKTLVWNVTLQRGFDVRVSVVDQFGKSLPRRNFLVFLDTEMLSHTGRGGEISMFKAQADEKGLLIVHHAGEFVYSFDYLGPFDGGKIEYCSPGLSYFSSIVEGRFIATTGTITYQKLIPQTVTISVIDKMTRLPISGAGIGEIVLYNSAAMGGDIGKTDQQGRFIAQGLVTEHLLSLTAHKEGYADFKFDMKNFQPGATCVFELQRK